MYIKRHKNRLTDYRKRFIYLSTSERRLVLRRTGKNIICCLVSYNSLGDIIHNTVSTFTLPYVNKNNEKWGYAVGYIYAKLQYEIPKTIDTGLFKLSKSSVLCAIEKGFKMQNTTTEVKILGQKYGLQL